MASLSLRNVYKIYDGNVTAVKDFNLEIADKEFIIFVGPSGCGKSTTLRMIAGLEDISKGELYIGDTLVNDVAPKDRDIAMVFQNYALYPHLTVYASRRLCPVVRDSVLPWVVPSFVIPAYSFSTSRCPTWTQSSVHRCVPRSPRSIRDWAPPSSM